MTQLDLPQISLQRYLDLLRRRRWQVIPVSILGLLIGGFVALLIPRYYVAETVISYTQVPGEKAGPLEDPMAEAVATAKLTIPLAVGDTIKQLGWDDYAGLDSYSAHEYESGVRSRIEIYDQNAGNKTARSFALIRITYRDQDGPRAANFLNGLVQVWMGRQLQKMSENTQALLKTANQRASYALLGFETTSADITNLERSSNVPLFGMTSSEEGVIKTQTENQKQGAQKQVDDLKVLRRKLAAELENLREVRDLIPRRVSPESITLIPGTIESDLQRRARILRDEILVLERRLAFMGPAHESKPMVTLMLFEKQQDLSRLLGADAANEVPNPFWGDQQGKVAVKENELQQIDYDLAAAEKTLAAWVLKQTQLARAFEEFRRLYLTLQEHKKKREAAQEEADRLNNIMGLLANTKLIEPTQRANVPPKPTEPNVLVVAVLGCLIGLGAAIGLILLVDILQGTFKTVEDVERAMPVPVLGGFAHLETEEVRQKARSSRRTASLVGGTVLVLVLAVVTIYYLDPTRLPAFARNVLALVLG